MKSFKIGIFGLGFVGLTTAVGFAVKFRDCDVEVVGYEIDKTKAESLSNGVIPFFESGLDDALKSVLNNNLKISTEIQEVLENANILIYCIGTPMGDDGSADVSYLLNALESTIDGIQKCAKAPVLLIKSTVPPSTTKEIFVPFVKKLLVKQGLTLGVDCIVANNPEFLREGFTYDDFINPDRIVIGTENNLGVENLKYLYSKFNAPLHFTNLNTAEFIKYLSNTTLSLNISFANEMSMIAQSIGDINIMDSFKILHADKRFSVGKQRAGIANYLYPGMGFGGYCLPKDTLALYKKAQENGYEAKILKRILEINNEILDFYVNKIQSEVDKNEPIGILGLSFKPNSDDVRGSKSADLIERLIKVGFNNIYAYDPIANDAFDKYYNLNINLAHNLKNIMQQCSTIIIATAWDEFKSVLYSDKKIYNLRFVG